MEASAFQTHQRYKHTGALPAPNAYKRAKMRRFYSHSILAAAGLNISFVSGRSVECLVNIPGWCEAVERMQLETAQAVVAFYHQKGRLPRPFGREFQLHMFVQRMARRRTRIEKGLLFEATLQVLDGIQWMERIDDTQFEEARELLEYFELNQRLP